MINFLDLVELCGSGVRIQPLWNIVNVIVNILMIGVPIALVIFGMWDLGKAVIASKEEEVKKATKLLGKRFLYAVGVFAVVWAVTFLFDTLSTALHNAEGYEDNTEWLKCWKCNIRGGGEGDACN